MPGVHYDYTFHLHGVVNNMYKHALLLPFQSIMVYMYVAILPAVHCKTPQPPLVDKVSPMLTFPSGTLSSMYFGCCVMSMLPTVHAPTQALY